MNGSDLDGGGQHPSKSNVCPPNVSPPNVSLDDLDGDRLREECGVFGIFGHPDATILTALGLHALQHRGQEAAGIVAFDGKRFNSERRLGLVGDHFSRESTIKRLPGDSAIGHVRYATTGETILRNVQPLFAELNTGGFAIGHNGNLTNAQTLRRELIEEGAIFQSTSDTEVHPASRRAQPQDAAHRALHRGAALDRRRLFAGRPLQQEADRRARSARHSPARHRRARRQIYSRLRDLRARHHRRALRARRPERRGRRHLRGRASRASSRSRRSRCGPASSNTSISRGPIPSCTARPSMRCARRWAPSSRANAGSTPMSSCRCPIRACRPRSAMRAGSGIPFELGIIRNHYVGRTFIQPTQSVRELGVRLKHSANRCVVAGKRVILHRRFDRARHHLGEDRADDARRRRAAKCISSSPRRRSPIPIITASTRRSATSCWPRRTASRRCARYIGSDSLAFLSIDGIYRAMGEASAIRSARNSPTIASPANIRPSSPM